VRDLKLKVLSFTPASQPAIREGLIGWSTFILNGVRFEHVAVRRTRQRRWVLSYTSRFDQAGAKHTVALPADPRERADVEREVIRQLGLERGVTP
jgi:hypothetical protein